MSGQRPREPWMDAFEDALHKMAELGTARTNRARRRAAGRIDRAMERLRSATGKRKIIDMGTARARLRPPRHLPLQ